ncbi:MAG: hypothetical protein AB7U75_09320 [Hyphomicrobiaceae bacterium]
MSMHVTGSFDSGTEIRVLNDAELKEVNGGLLFGLLVLADLFMAGVLAGEIAANYKYTGNALGRIPTHLK